MTYLNVDAVLDADGAPRILTGYCWGYQHLFHSSSNRQLAEVLHAVNFSGEVRLDLVGVQMDDTGNCSIALQPEMRTLELSPFLSTPPRARYLYENGPEHSLIHTDPTVHANRHRGLRTEALGDALAEALAESLEGNFKLFVSYPTLVEEYYIYLIASLDESAYESVPRLTTERRSSISIYRSLVDACIRIGLRHLARSLYIPNVGLSAEIPSTGEITREAAEAFMNSIFVCAGELLGSNMDTVFTNLSLLPYEGRIGKGRLVVGSASHTPITMRLELKSKVRLRDTRALRKLLEATRTDFDLISDGEVVSGFGLLDGNYNSEEERAFVVEFTDRGTWRCQHADSTLMVVHDGKPSLPVQFIDDEDIVDKLHRVIGEDCDNNSLIKAVHAASRALHGSMIVISSAAEAEAERLAPQAWQTVPVRLSEGEVTELANVDGALILDKQANCHAVGAILDGIATGSGDPSRGSRYNNVERYLASSPANAVVVTFSEDGLVDVSPKLNPMVSRERIKKIVDDFLDAANDYIEGRVEYPAPRAKEAETWAAVKAHSFYLSEEQIQKVNDAQEAVQAYDRTNNHIVMVESHLTPDERMNDSYFTS